ncbi:unnamed protein product, partial [Ilex paraguariensis]
MATTERERDLELLLPVASIVENKSLPPPVAASSHRHSSGKERHFVSNSGNILHHSQFHSFHGCLLSNLQSSRDDGINVFGLGFITSITFIFLVGIFMSSWLGASVLGLGEWFIKKMPLVSYIYSASKQISAAIFPDQSSNAFEEVAIIRQPRIGEYAFGFITSTFILQRSAGEVELSCVYMASATLICDTEPWKALKTHVEDIKKTHLRELMGDTDRDYDGILLDYSRQCATLDTLEKLFKLAEAAHLKQKINSMFSGEHINSTENRSVLHIALRASKDAVIYSDGKNVVPDVWHVLNKIRDFSERVRSGSWVGATGKALKDVVAIGIGGSFLGPLFVHTALQTDPEAIECARGRQLRFLANVDPIDVARNITGLNPETTLVVVVSKTFTTAETMLNARTLREWISSALGPQAVAKHMVAVSTNLTLVEKFGIDPNNAFAFWDWVGGRYSVCSSVGVFPLSLQYGFPVIEKY